MAAPRPLSRITLPEEVVQKDRRKCARYDQCGLGEKAVYLGSALMPRRYYIPYEAITHVFKRVAVSNGAGKGFLAPILYLVVRYDDGQERQCSFRYLQDADKMLDAIESAHPEIALMSPEGVQKAREKRQKEAAIENAVLSDAEEHEVRLLNNAKLELEKRPGLYEKLAVTAKRKRTADLTNPRYQTLAAVICSAGVIAILAGLLLMHRRVGGSLPLLVILAGAAAVFLMINSGALPTPSHSRKALTKAYNEALAAMEKSLRNTTFPFAAAYAHPIVLERCIRIIKEGRAETALTALEELKRDLKAADSSVALSGKDYSDVITIKPLFTVNDYR